MIKIFQFIIFLFFILLSLFTHSFAQDKGTNPYLVEGIYSKNTGKNPELAKKNTIKYARRDALTVLLARISKPLSISEEVSDDEITEMVRSEQILDEKISGNNYSANFNFVFAKDFVEHILGQKKSNLEADVSEPKKVSEKFTIIPVKMAINRPMIWEDENDWRIILSRVVEKNDLENKFIIPTAKKENILLFNSQNITNLSTSEIESAIAKNETRGIYIFNFSFDEIDNKVIVKSTYLEPQFKKNFSLAFTNADKIEYNELIKKVAEKTLDFVEKNPITVQSDFSNKNPEVDFKISSFSDWLFVKNSLEKGNLIEKIEIKSISRDNVKAKLQVAGSKLNIEEIFNKLNLKYLKLPEGTYEINAVSQ